MRSGARARHDHALRTRTRRPAADRGRRDRRPTSARVTGRRDRDHAREAVVERGRGRRRVAGAAGPSRIRTPRCAGARGPRRAVRVASPRSAIARPSRPTRACVPGSSQYGREVRPARRITEQPAREAGRPCTHASRPSGRPRTCPAPPSRRRRSGRARTSALNARASPGVRFDVRDDGGADRDVGSRHASSGCQSRLALLRERARSFFLVRVSPHRDELRGARRGRRR